MDLRSFITHQVVFVQPVLSSRALPAVNGEVSWQMGRGLIGSVDVAPVLYQNDLKQLEQPPLCFLLPNPP